MPNVARQMSNYPSPSLSWGRNLAEESIKALPGEGQKAELKKYLENQGANMLKRASKDIILSTDTLNMFFEKLAEVVSIAPKVKIPTVDQFMGKSTIGGVQKQIIASPIPRSAK